MEVVDITFWASPPCCWKDADNIYRDRSLGQGVFQEMRLMEG